jgi:hypothetical protein
MSTNFGQTKRDELRNGSKMVANNRKGIMILIITP